MKEKKPIDLKWVHGVGILQDGRVLRHCRSKQNVLQRKM